jgi:hypothetical protein
MGRPRSLKSQEPAALPMARYFAVVGSALIALLMVVGRSLPRPADGVPDRPEIVDGATIRIHSTRKWPDKVVLDTSQPTFSLPPIDTALAQDLVEHPSEGTTDRASVDALVDSRAQPAVDAHPIGEHHSTERTRRTRARATRSTRVARARSPSQLQGLGEECCWFEPTDGRPASRTASRKRVARRDSWTGWHFPDAD